MDLSIIIVLGIGFVVYAGMIILQIYWSKHENKWLGLILPAITFLASLLYVISIMDTGDALMNAVLILITLLITNIPTFILLGIYFTYKSKQKKNEQIDKMNIHDL